jgi:hypothetical protein
MAALKLRIIPKKHISLLKIFLRSRSSGTQIVTKRGSDFLPYIQRVFCDFRYLLGRLQQTKLSDKEQQDPR